MIMGRKPKSKEEKDEKRRIRQLRYYYSNRERLNKNRMRRYWEIQMGKALSELQEDNNTC